MSGFLLFVSGCSMRCNDPISLLHLLVWRPKEFFFSAALIWKIYGKHYSKLFVCFRTKCVETDLFIWWNKCSDLVNLVTTLLTSITTLYQRQNDVVCLQRNIDVLRDSNKTIQNLYLKLFSKNAQYLQIISFCHKKNSKNLKIKILRNVKYKGEIFAIQ